MCVVSMVTDHFQHKWPLPRYQYDQSPLIPLPTPFVITKSQWDEYQELKRKAIEYDKQNNQPNCEKEGVTEWESRIEEVLRKNGLIK